MVSYHITCSGYKTFTLFYTHQGASRHITEHQGTSSNITKRMETPPPPQEEKIK
jgi:hypothetical protein